MAKWKGLCSNGRYVIVFDEAPSHYGWLNAKVGAEANDLSTIKQWAKDMKESGRYKSVHILKKVL